MNPYSIRKATKEDISNLYPLLLESQLFQKQELEKETIKDLNTFKEDILKNIEDWINHDDKAYLIALNKKQEIVGYVLGFLDTTISYSGSLSDLFVLSEYRGKGIAKLLVEKIIEWMKENGMKTIGLAVSKNNQTALNLYKKLGFEEKSDNYILMEKELG